MRRSITSVTALRRSPTRPQPGIRTRAVVAGIAVVLTAPQVPGQTSATGSAPATALRAPLPAASPAPAGTVPPLVASDPWGSTIRLEVSDRFRGEFVDWFATTNPSPTQQFRYNFLGNKFQLGVRWQLGDHQMFAQYQHSLIDNLPTKGVGPGGTYYANTRSTFQEESILRQGWFQEKNLFGLTGLSTQFGRFLYADGNETVAKDATLQWLKRWRIGQRLIGPFDYTHIGRSFDGGQLVYDEERFNVTGFGFIPTAGGYEISANREIPSIHLGGLALTLKDSAHTPGWDARGFWIEYRDDRDVLVLDNRPKAVREADVGEPITLHTFGANVLHAQAIGPGKLDFLAWVAGQLGDWQGQDIRAYSFLLEAGYAIDSLPGKPWLRAGINYGSGDDTPDDDVHASFYQILPTARLYALTPFYNMMNNRDVFVALYTRPLPSLTIDLLGHWLTAPAKNDFVYFGGGPTKEDFFGYGGTPAAGHHELAYVIDLQASWKALDFLTLSAYYGHAFGQGIVNTSFTGRQLNYGYVEGTVAF